MNESKDIKIGTEKDTVSDELKFNFIPEKYGIGVEEITVEEIKTKVKQLEKRANEANESKGLFLVKTANRWIKEAKARPIPRMLFSEFWYEGELCILFSDTNLGKSILAVQIGNSITRNEQIKGFKMEAPGQPVLYFDFELSDKQFEARYSINYEQQYTWNENFYRAEINPEEADYKEHGFKTFEQFLYASMEHSITETQAKILIIDNITYLKDETEKAKSALPLMKYLQGLKKKFGLSILALAHTPKRDLSKPISRNDLQGSKMLINFCDSAFAIGENSRDKNIRYLKQIKARNTEIIYDTENVCTCQITKPDNFLMFEFLGFGKERDHLKQISESEKTELENNIKELLQTEPTLTAYAVAKKLCSDETNFNSFKVKVSRIMNKISNTSNTSNNVTNVTNVTNVKK